MDKIGYMCRILFSAKFKGHGSVLLLLLVYMFGREATNTDPKIRPKADGADCPR